MSLPTTLADWLTHLEKLHPSTIELGLGRVQEVAGRLKLDFGKARVITVGGTNGKGSSVTMLAGILRAGGFNVVTYTSPHLLKYNERVGLTGRLASDAELCAGFAAVEAARGQTSLTYFEFGTLGALWLFAQIKPDFIILEVGLGGRLDAVNIIDADASLLTNVDLDHTDWLGDTRDKIGFEKAGIFRTDKPAIYGEVSLPDSVRAYASANRIPLLLQGRDFGWRNQGGLWQWFGRTETSDDIELSGLPRNGFPLDNAAAVLQVLHSLAVELSRAAIEKGLAEAQLAGRFQQEQYQGIPVILDVAHNPHAARNLVSNISGRLQGKTVHLVLGMLADKDSASVVQLLAPAVSHIYAASLGGERGAPADILYNHARQSGHSHISCHTSPQSAFAEAIATARKAGKDSVVLVTGSFFTLGAILELL